MRFFKIIRWGLFVTFFCLLGCSSLHVDVSPTLDWNAVSEVVLHEPSQDPWDLTPAIRKELRKIGIKVLNENNGEPDLQIRYFTKEGPDLDSDGNQITRLKSLHMQFVDPATKKNVGVVDYFYADSLSESIKGVEAAFAGLQEDINAARVSQFHTHQKTAPEPATPTPAVYQHGNTLSAEKVPPHQEPATNLRKLFEQKGASADTFQQLESNQQIDTSVNVTEQGPEIKPKTRSPWIPRFKSWGFENWGEQTADEN